MANLFAALINGETLALGIPILALMIPIIAVLAQHQQKMASIIHGGLGSQSKAEIDALKAEVQELRAMMFHQSATLEELKRLQAPAEPAELGTQCFQSSTTE